MWAPDFESAFPLLRTYFCFHCCGATSLLSLLLQLLFSLFSLFLLECGWIMEWGRTKEKARQMMLRYSP